MKMGIQSLDYDYLSGFTLHKNKDTLATISDVARFAD